MGAGIGSLEQAVMAADITNDILGKAIGFQGFRRHDESADEPYFLVFGAWYLDKWGNLRTNIAEFRFKEKGGNLEVSVTMNHEEAYKMAVDKEKIQGYCSPKEFTRQNMLEIFYVVDKFGGPKSRCFQLAGIHVPGTNIKMVVDGVEFYGEDEASIGSREHPQETSDREIQEPSSLDDKAGQPLRDYVPEQSDDTLGLVAFPDIVEGYRPRAMDKQSKEYNSFQVNIRNPLKNAGIYEEDKIKRGNRIYFDTALLPEIHRLLHEAGYTWRDPESPWAPERWPLLNEPNSGDNPKPKSGHEDAKPDKDEEPIDRAAIDEAVNKALKDGDIKLGTAVYYLFPAEYKARGDKISNLAEGMRESVRDYALTELLKKKIVYLAVGSELAPMIRAEKIPRFYQEVVGHFQNDFQAFVKDTGGLIKDVQPDIRYTPRDIELFYNFILDTITRNPGASRTFIEKKMQGKWFESMRGFKYFHMLKSLAEEVHKKTKDLPSGITIEYDKAEEDMEKEGIRDPFKVIMRNEDKISSGDNYSFRSVKKLITEIKFKQEHPNVFYY